MKMEKVGTHRTKLTREELATACYITCLTKIPTYLITITDSQCTNSYRGRIKMSKHTSIVQTEDSSIQLSPLFP